MCCSSVTRISNKNHVAYKIKIKNKNHMAKQKQVLRYLLLKIVIDKSHNTCFWYLFLWATKYFLPILDFDEAHEVSNRSIVLHIRNKYQLQVWGTSIIFLSSKTVSEKKYPVFYQKHVSETRIVWFIKNKNQNQISYGSLKTSTRSCESSEISMI